MKFTIYRSTRRGDETNAFYPIKTEVTNEASLKRAAETDHVCAEYKNNHRANDDFISSDVIPLDCDNTHSDKPEAWISPSDIASTLPDTAFAVVYSRNNMKPKDGKTARPKFHAYFPIPTMTDSAEYAKLKRMLVSCFPFFDDGAKDSARFLFGVENPQVKIYSGKNSILDFLEEQQFAALDKPANEIHTGERNNRMSHTAGKIIKRFGNTPKAHEMFLDQAAKCNPPLDDTELASIWNSAVKFGEKLSREKGYIPPEEYNKTPNWEKPIPFDEYNLPPFPVDTLPKSIAEYVSALSESTQTPVDMAATSALAILSVCMQGKFKIRAKADWTEPVNTFVLNVMNPSERKSAVQNAMLKPLNLYEAEQNTRNAALIESSKMQKRILEKRQKAVEDQAAKGKADADTVTKIAEEIADYREVRPMKLYVDDITTEKLTSVLAANDGRAAILSTEGGIFDTLSGAYSKTVNIDVMLKGYSGDSIRVDRIGRNSESILSPTLTILLMVQPSVLSGLMGNGTFRGRGLTARFLYCIPKSYVGRRKYRSAPIPDEVYQNYAKCIWNLLEDDVPDEPEIITLSEDADKMIGEFAERLEPELTRKYADISDWAGKLVGNILRIAALLCRSDVLRGHELFDKVPDPLCVDGETMMRAIQIGEYFTEHARAAFMLMGADRNTENCKKVLAALKENKVSEFTRRDVMRLCRSFKKAEDVQLVLDMLIEYGYIAEKSSEPWTGKGRPPLTKYVVNPNV